MLLRYDDRTEVSRLYRVTRSMLHWGMAIAWRPPGWLALLLVPAVTACGGGTEGSTSDASAETGSDGGDARTDADEVSPCDELPVEGSPCVGSGFCSYPPPKDRCTDTPLWVVCTSGKWAYMCVAKPPGT